MTNHWEDLSEDDIALIQDFAAKALVYTQALVALLKSSSKQLGTAQYLIQELGVKDDATWDFIQQISLEARKSLLPVFLEAAGTWNYPCMGRAQEQILRLPKDWLLENLESAIHTLLENDPFEGYTLLIELYSDLDFTKAINWAKIAAKHEHTSLNAFAMKWLIKNEV